MVSYSVDYNKMGEAVNMENGDTFQIYGNEFNPTRPGLVVQGESDDIIYNQSTSYNLSGFQVGNEVCAFGFRLRRDGTGSASAKSQYFTFELLRSSDGSSWSAGWTSYHTLNWTSKSYDPDVDWWERWNACWYFGVDKDEVRPGYTYYKFHVTSSDGIYDFFSPTINTYNLSFDSSLHDAGYLRVEGAFLCYTDCIGFEAGYNNKGYKHMVLYDTDYSGGNVGSEYAGSIWMEDDVVRRIYYIDQYGYKRRTHEAKNWYGYTSGQGASVGTARKGCIRCPGNYDYAEDGYGYLCFVNPNGYKMRLGNGVLH